MLTIRKLRAGYGDFQALFGIDLDLAEGETLAIIGSNGAGKSTFLRSLAGLIRNDPGSIRFKDEYIGSLPANQVLERGIALVPEGRKLFPSLSVEENLLIGGYSKRQGAWNLERIYSLFPVLADLRKRPGTALSGGQQQMVAIGRALMSSPSLLLCDEISLGLAPTTIKDIYAALPSIKADGTAVILVEQDINQALAVADRFYCFQEGRVSLSGKPGEASKDQIKAAYFGLAEA
ncbi:ABC transporter ATP-binding protein [Pseudomonas sp. JS3066]|jgi:branched-chain amino acid transport system ATP-binding protein|uniref:ABC transporter ATP-binding protein n=1 Tax=unclassified Pseudomonas TaxID=196821 RepID=UPI000EAA7433|nr:MULTISPECIES: ABC transporter ATP-binding protein [unclassified Pseudomonas]AYF86585.1 ABC transporter ATP-binding protein [Pseudomonas sp. DY-1]MDH4654676.1 ABC transporter ATP-binding protein [Pseudomonas sp. BN606]MRK23939.1 ABC transporter ATP-binding protein [Pseudomonas sp. JG-B]WVK95944.1 ABC transporter ATP-binding protein [Pseudomonas sp. JS3066]